MSTDPWSDLQTPTSHGKLSARRVSANNPWDLFWARNAHGDCLLVMQHSTQFPSDLRLPELKGISVSRADAGPGSFQLFFALEDAELKDIFARLCDDIATAAASAETEAGAIRTAVSRTWRWHYLLTRGSGRLLEPEEQKGLIGELLTLELLLDHLAPSAAVDAWQGPLGAPKDFLFRGMAIECKAPRGVEQPFVRVTSEWQLDGSEVDELFLVVVPVDRSTASDPGALTLPQVVERVRHSILQRAPAAIEGLDSRLLSAGLRPEDDYSEFWWEAGDWRCYAVRSGFPRIEGSELIGGVAGVRYQVALASCAGFEVDVDEILSRCSDDES